MTEDILFEVLTPIGFRVRTTVSRWQIIVGMKHPVMRSRENDVREALRDPDEVRRSRSDPSVLLFYRLEHLGRWTCAVAKQAGSAGFLVTAYPTYAIKAGDRVWSK